MAAKDTTVPLDNTTPSEENSRQEKVKSINVSFKERFFQDTHLGELITKWRDRNKVDPEAEKLKTKVPDEPPRKVYTVTPEEIEQYLSKETGRDRLKAMYEENDYQKMSSEFMICLESTKFTAFLNFLIFNCLGSLEAKEKFIREHRHVKFPTRFRAVRRYQDAIIMGGLKTGGKWAIKTGAFISLFMFTSQSIAVYRNKTSIMEYSAAGALACSILRFNMGPKGMFAGGIIGVFLGSLAGVALYSSMHFFNETQEERHYRDIAHSLLTQKELMGFLDEDTKGVKDES